MDENSLKQCGRNKMSKVFYYCLKAETEVNNETAKKYYKVNIIVNGQKCL